MASGSGLLYAGRMDNNATTVQDDVAAGDKAPLGRLLLHRYL